MAPRAAGADEGRPQPGLGKSCGSDREEQPPARGLQAEQDELDGETKRIKLKAAFDRCCHGTVDFSREACTGAYHSLCFAQRGREKLSVS